MQRQYANPFASPAEGIQTSLASESVFDNPFLRGFLLGGGLALCFAAIDSMYKPESHTLGLARWNVYRTAAVVSSTIAIGISSESITSAFRLRRLLSFPLSLGLLGFTHNVVLYLADSLHNTSRYRNATEEYTASQRIVECKLMVVSSILLVLFIVVLWFVIYTVSASRKYLRDSR